MASFASAAPLGSFAGARPYERRFTLALAFSGAMHAAIAVVATAILTLLPPTQPPAASDRPALIAVLQTVQPTPEVEVATPSVAPEPVREPPRPMAVPVPSPMAAAPPPVAPAPARALPAPARGPITSTDANGSVTMGMLETPALLGPGFATRLADRYPGRVDKLPRLIGSMVVPYPAAARQAHASARIAAILDVDERGKITHLALVPEHAWFGPAVTEALKEARFAPAELATNPVSYWAIVEFVFAIAPGSPVASAEGPPPSADGGGLASAAATATQN
ncbi:MAG: energy transducer TonB [Casimicrobiaceae bacterium]